MIVTAWNNGKYFSSGAGYGLKIKRIDRDSFFNRDWHDVILMLPEMRQELTININKASFWNGCRELIHKDIGLWFFSNQYAPWLKGNPPKFELMKHKENIFVLKGAIKP